MSVRINKVMGYGLTDLSVEEVQTGIYYTNDTRFNPDGWWHNKQKKWNSGGYISHCNAVNNRFLQLTLQINGATRFDNVINTIHYVGSDAGKANVVLFVPPTRTDFYRYDDPIDYMESIGECVVKELQYPIYPASRYINRETGEFVDNSVLDVRELIYLFNNSSNPETKEYALTQLGCKETWMERYNVEIPIDLVEFLRYTEMFTDDSTIWKLKPLIYTYWS